MAAALVRGCRSLERVPLLVRHFSVSAYRGDLVKPPIQVFGIEGRYAHAVYSAAARAKQLDKIEAELNKVEGLIKSNEKLYEFILNPTLDKREKQSALKEILTKQNLSKITMNLFDALAENNRLKLTNSVVKAFSKLMSATRGEVICTVTTAKFPVGTGGGLVKYLNPSTILNAINVGLAKLLKDVLGTCLVPDIDDNKELDAAHMKELQAGLKGFLKKGEVLQLETKVDPSLIGGMVVNIGDKYIDMSISSKVRNIKNALKESLD